MSILKTHTNIQILVRPALISVLEAADSGALSTNSSAYSANSSADCIIVSQQPVSNMFNSYRQIAIGRLLPSAKDKSAKLVRGLTLKVLHMDILGVGLFFFLNDL